MLRSQEKKLLKELVASPPTSPILLDIGERAQIETLHAIYTHSIGWAAVRMGVAKAEPVRDEFKPVGEILYYLHEVAKHLNALQVELGYGDSIPTGFERWQRLANEFKSLDFACVGLPNQKYKKIEEMRELGRKIKNCLGTGHNPFDPKVSPEAFNLFSEAIHLAKRDPTSKRKVKKIQTELINSIQECSKAVTAWAQELDRKPYRAIQAEGEKLVILGRGGQKTFVNFS